jgi:Fe-S-cluster containining protein
MADGPWYKDGLRFQCTGCGDCCTGAPGYVWVNQAEVQAIANQVGLPIDEFTAKYVRKVGVRQSLVEYDDGACVFLDPTTRKCTVYEARPRQCRTWPFWESNLKSRKAWEECCEVCPGSGRGKLYSIEHIVEQKNIFRV